MKARSFKEQAKIQQLEGFKEKLDNLKKIYSESMKRFNDLCDQLDHHVLNEEQFEEVTSNISFYSMDIELIEQSIRNILESLDNIKNGTFD